MPVEGGGTRQAGGAAPRRGQAARLREFFGGYTDGMSAEELRRLFGDDAARAYAVLVRDQEGEDGQPAGRVRRFLWRVKLLFLGLSAKLTPGRRLVFAGSLVCALFGLVETADSSPGFFLLAVAGLVYLLAVELVDRVLVRDELQVARQL